MTTTLAPSTPSGLPGPDVWALRRVDPERAEALSRELLAAGRGGEQQGAGAALLTLAFCRLDAADYGAASAWLREAEASFAAPGDEPGTLQVGILRGVIACRRGEYRAARAEALGASRRARRTRAPAQAASALLLLGEVHGYLGNYRRTQGYLERALGAARGLGDRWLVSEAHLFLSRTQRAAGAYEGALRDGLAALGQKRAYGDPLGEAYALNNLGLIYHDPHSSGEALGYYLEGLALAERLGNRRCNLVLLGNLGELYADLGDAEKALPYVRQSLALSEEIGSQQTLGISLEGLGDLYARLGDTGAALAAYERALALRERLGDKQGQASTLHALGRFYGNRSEPEKGASYLERSLAVARDIGHPYTEAQVLATLGGLYLPRDPSRAGEVYRAALALAERLALPALVRDCAAALAELSETQRDFRGAVGYLKTLRGAERGLSDERAARRTQLLLARFELEQAQRAAEAERRHRLALAETNRALEATARQNRKLLARLQRQTERLKEQATRDALTGLFNRRYAERQLRREFARSRRHARALSVALADLDNFKGINDTFSHAVGDGVLRAVADLVRTHLRPADLAARYGGEEFVLVLPETDAAGARALAERLRLAVAAFPWATLHPDLRVTLSIGVCSDPASPSYERLLSVADENLYAAKGGGKNRVV